MYTVGNTISEAVDNVFIFIVVISVILLVIVTGMMLYFAYKYSRKRHPEPKKVKESMWLEVLWTVIPTILVLFMFYYGYEGFKLMREVPEDAMVVHVTGRMWDWTFEYENGRKEKDLYVPKEKSVKLLLKSVDVVHSFYVPAFRVKEDVVPGQENYLWFKPQTVGPADIFCAEFCGQRHAYMLAQVIVMEPAEFEKWYAAGDPKPKVHPAVALMEEVGCLDCHSLDDSAGDRHSLKGLAGSIRVVIEDGKEKEVIADEAYIRRSIMEPSAQIVKGKDEEMEPPEDLSNEQIDSIVEYLNTKKGTPVPKKKEDSESTK